MEKLHKDGLLESLDFVSLDTCEPCLMGKMTRTPFNGTMERAVDLLGIIHTDVCGPMNITARNGFRYFVTFTDDLSRYGYIYLKAQYIDQRGVNGRFLTLLQVLVFFKIEAMQS